MTIEWILLGYYLVSFTGSCIGFKFSTDELNVKDLLISLIGGPFIFLVFLLIFLAFLLIAPFDFFKKKKILEKRIW